MSVEEERGVVRVKVKVRKCGGAAAAAAVAVVGNLRERTITERRLTANSRDIQWGSSASQSPPVRRHSDTFPTRVHMNGNLISVEMHR